MRFKKSTFWAQKVHFVGVLSMPAPPPKKINSGYELVYMPDTLHTQLCTSCSSPRQILHPGQAILELLIKTIYLACFVQNAKNRFTYCNSNAIFEFLRQFALGCLHYEVLIISR